MSTRTKIAWGAGYLLLVFLVVGCVVVWTVPITLNDLRFHTRFHLKGIVVNEQGKPLDQVQLRITGWRVVEHTITDHREESHLDSYIVHGKFDLRTVPYTKVSVSASREGYYSKHWGFDQEHPPQIDLVPVDPGNLRIVLEKHGRLSELLEYHPLLNYSPEVGATVFDFDRQGRDIWHSDLGALTRSVPAGIDPANGHPQALYLTAELDPTGHIATGRILPLPTRSSMPLPKRLTLHLADPQGGFVQFTPKPLRCPAQQMRQAPEAGYQTTLTLTDADVIASGGEPHYTTYFFFKVGGKFGRGAVAHSQINQAGRNVMLSVVLLLQPDGSRDLEQPETRENGLMASQH